MAPITIEISQRKAAKAAGFMFLFIVTGWILNWTFVDSKLAAAGNATATVNNIMANEQLFRIGITNELIFAVAGIVLAWALYILLKPVSRNLALLALLWKLAETIVGTIMVLSAFLALQMLHGNANLAACTPGQVQEVIGLFLAVRSNGSTVAMIFLGLDFTLFFYLLFRSKYVPKVLAGFGIVSYALILIFSLATIILPPDTAGQSMVTAISMIFFMPSVIFEIVVGLWLLIKGVRIQ